MVFNWMKGWHDSDSNGSKAVATGEEGTKSTDPQRGRESCNQDATGTNSDHCRTGQSQTDPDRSSTADAPNTSADNPIDQAPVPEQAENATNANIVIFGETGAGKSSVINLIAGEALAGTSNDARGCTSHYGRHPITLEDNTSFVLWDTAGLEEGSKGTVPAMEAEEGLKELLKKLACSGGIKLVIYCIRCSRLSRDLKRNYDSFYVTACRKQVPVALVVTGLEDEEGSMDNWWHVNEKVLEEYGMQFDEHVCVTTLEVNDDTVKARRSESQKRLRELVIKYSQRPAWRNDSSLILSATQQEAVASDVPQSKNGPGTDGAVKKHGNLKHTIGSFLSQILFALYRFFH